MSERQQAIKPSIIVLQKQVFARVNYYNNDGTISFFSMPLFFALRCAAA
jgi:hypothetical protein